MKAKNKNNPIGFSVKVFFNKLTTRKENLKSANNIQPLVVLPPSCHSKSEWLVTAGRAFKRVVPAVST